MLFRSASEPAPHGHDGVRSPDAVDHDGVRSPDEVVRERLVDDDETLRLNGLGGSLHSVSARFMEEPQIPVFHPPPPQRREPVPRRPPLCRCEAHVWAREFDDGMHIVAHGRDYTLLHDMPCEQIQIIWDALATDV